LALLAGYAVLAVKWIEIRHALPFLPAFFILAGILTTAVLPRLRAGGYRALPVALGLIVAAAWIPKGLLFTGLFPSLEATTLGRLADVGLLVLAAAGGGLLFWVLKPAFSLRVATRAACVPFALLIALFASYEYVESVPRWRAWRVEMADPRLQFVQELHLPAPLAPEEIGAAAWLVDLETSDPPPLAVTVNGEEPSAGGATWEPLSCSPRAPCRLQPVYELRSRFAGRPLTGWPQWWRLRVAPALVANRRVLWLGLRPQPATPPPTLGGVFEGEGDASFDGPDLGGRTSIYRWTVLEDWRPWVRAHLASRHTRSFLGASEGASVPGPLAALLRRRDARFNARLWVMYKNGNEAFF
jgi:hypothetical protein